MIAVVTPAAYATAVVVGLGGCAVACTLARRRPGPWTTRLRVILGCVLFADAGAYLASLATSDTFSWSTSLPLPLCDIGALVAGLACVTSAPVLVELTYFWGLVGTLQGVLTPDLSSGFPHLVFFEYVVGHVGIVFAALFLVIGVGSQPRRGAVRRMFAITIGYSAFVGAVDAATGANYMFLRRPPGEWTVLRLLGPWPWYLASASALALALFVALDAPFWHARRRRDATPRRAAAGVTHTAA